MTADFEETRAQLPLPLRDEPFTHHKHGIADDPATDVYVNARQDFATLHPIPHVDYVHYETRRDSLKLPDYQKGHEVAARTLAKIDRLIPHEGALLEVGAGDAPFLSVLRPLRPALQLASLEVDESTRAARDRVENLVQYERFEQLTKVDARFDVVCLLHVLEHIVEPASFLAELGAVLAPGGLLIVEVPSMDDPLLSLHGAPPVAEYRDFFFQRQHPYTYTAASLERLLSHHGFQVDEVIGHQRYGLENHFTWLGRGVPGGNPVLAEMLPDTDAHYRRELEAAGKTDAVIAVARGRH